VLNLKVGLGIDDLISLGYQSFVEAEQILRKDNLTEPDLMTQFDETREYNLDYDEKRAA
jgi:hypothetical protein